MQMANDNAPSLDLEVDDSLRALAWSAADRLAVIGDYGDPAFDAALKDARRGNRDAALSRHPDGSAAEIDLTALKMDTLMMQRLVDLRRAKLEELRAQALALGIDPSEL